MEGEGAIDGREVVSMKEVHIYRGCEHYIVEQQTKGEKKRGRGKAKSRREVPLSRRQLAFCLHAQPGDHGPAVCDGAAVYRCGAGGRDHGVYGRNDKKDT